MRQFSSLSWGQGSLRRKGAIEPMPQSYRSVFNASCGGRARLRAGDALTGNANAHRLPPHASPTAFVGARYGCS
jgi:hypothetical protein